MATATMNLDLLDRAFIGRLGETDPATTAPPARDVEPLPAATTFAKPATRPPLSSVPGPQPPDARAEPATGSVLDRLLHAAAAQWAAVADAVERAIADRDRSLDGDDRAGFVIAVVCRRPKDGCTTFVAGLARTLQGRGIDVRTTTFDSIVREGGAVQLVDGGAWFGSGPIRRERATTLAEACDAAILLRRADRSTATAFARALEVAGVRVLGEVTTFGREPAPEVEAAT